MSKRTIVLGATGLIGSYLVSQLSNAKHIDKVIAITRKPVHYESSKIQNVVINFDHLADYSDAFKGDCLFSCLGTTVKQAGSISEQRKVDFDYQLQAAKFASDNGVSEYYLVSSSGANSKSLSPYLKMKGELENAINLLAFSKITILQPSLLLGERPNTRTAENLGSLILPILCKLPGLRRYRPIHGSQVASKIVGLSSQSSTGLQTLNLDELF